MRYLNRSCRARASELLGLKQLTSINQLKFIFWVKTQKYNLYKGSIQKAAGEALCLLNWPLKQTSEHNYEYFRRNIIISTSHESNKRQLARLGLVATNSLNDETQSMGWIEVYGNLSIWGLGGTAVWLSISNMHARRIELGGNSIRATGWIGIDYCQLNNYY